MTNHCSIDNFDSTTIQTKIKISPPFIPDFAGSPYTVHRNPLYWSDPEAFRPERFASEAEKNIPKSAYLPFSSGPRNCIGESLAMMEMMIHVAIIAQKLRLEYRETASIELEAQVNLRPKNDLMMVPIAR